MRDSAVKKQSVPTVKKQRSKKSPAPVSTVKNQNPVQQADSNNVHSQKSGADFLSFTKTGSIPDSASKQKNAATTVDSNKLRMEELFSNKSREDLYREIFKTAPPPLPKQLDASLIINDEVEDLVEIILSDDRRDFYLPALPVIKKLSAIAIPELVQKVKTVVDKQGKLSQSALEKLGLNTTFDKNDYQVRIIVPSKALLRQMHYLSGGERENPYSFESIKPNNVSAFVNIQANQRMNYRQVISNDISPQIAQNIKDGNKEFRQPFYCNLDGTFNVHNVVLEGLVLYEQSADPSFKRQDVRLVYDLPKSAIRFTAGDIKFSTLGYYQSGMRAGGISITKDYSLQPHIITYPVGEYEFYLTDPAEVEVWVDDIMVRRMALEAGTHDIRGFPFSTGNNNVKIMVKDYAGRRDTMHFSFLYQSSTLAAGKSKYSCVAAVPNRVVDQQYNYLTDRPCLSLAYRRGFTNRLTCDFSTQAFLSDSMDQANVQMGMVGFGGLYAIPRGLLDWDIAGGYGNSTGSDFATRLGYSFQSPVSYKNAGKMHANIGSLNTPFVCRTQVEYIGKNFTRNQYDAVVRSIEALKITSDINVPLGERLNINVGGMYYVRRDTSNYFTVSLRLQKNWLSRLNTGLTFQYSVGDDGRQANPAIMANAQWSFRADAHDFSVSEQIKKHNPDISESSTAPPPQWDFNTCFQWCYDDATPRPEKLTASLMAITGDMINDYNAQVGFTGNQGTIEINQVLDEPMDSSSTGKFLQHQTNLSLKTALVYVDKTLAFSRPIYNGFVLAKGVKNLKNNKIIVNPTDQGYEAITNRFGPAVLPLYSSYQLRRLRLVPIDAPMGTGDLELKPVLFPQYKSGFLLSLGSDQNVVVLGSILDVNSNPFAYKTITIKSVGRKKIDSTQTFTNGSGRFQFQAAEGATYEISSQDPGMDKPLRVEIPKAADGFCRIGDLRIPLLKEVAAAIPKPGKTMDSIRVPIAAVAKEAVADSTRIAPDSAMVKTNVFRHDADDSSTHVLGTLVTGKAALAYTSVAILSLEDLQSKGINTFTDKNGDFQIICQRPGRYKIIVARTSGSGGIDFLTTSFEVPYEKMGFYYHLGKLILVRKGSKDDTSSVQKGSTQKRHDSLQEKIAGIELLAQGIYRAQKRHDSLQEKMAGIVLLAQGIYVSGKLAGQNDQLFGFTSIAIVSLEDTLSVPMQTFTNKDGAFQIICNAPGRYRIFLTNSEDGPGATFDIPPDTKGILDIGVKKLGN